MTTHHTYSVRFFLYINSRTPAFYTLSRGFGVLVCALFGLCSFWFVLKNCAKKLAQKNVHKSKYKFTREITTVLP